MDEQPARILIVDDEPAILFTMEVLLKRRGYVVTAAADGQQALDLLDQSAFDLLLLDLKMPGLSGVEIAERARELQPAASILILTGSSAIEGAPEELELGGFEYIIKTADTQEVLERIAEVLAR